MKIKIKQIFVSVMSLLLMITLISPSSVYAETYFLRIFVHCDKISII